MDSKRARHTREGQIRDRRLLFLEEARRHTPYVVAEAGDGMFLVSTADGGVDRGLFAKQARPEFRVLSRAVTAVEALTGHDAIAGRQFVDVGANIGTATVHALLSERFGSAVACEPEQEGFHLLRANLALNDLADRVQPLQVAVSNEVGSLQLVALEGRKGSSWIALDRARIRAARVLRARRLAEELGASPSPPRAPAQLAPMAVASVEAVTLDHLAATGVIDTDRVGMVWIDVEGHEGHVLEGAGRLVDRGVPTVFEFHPEVLLERGDMSSVHAVVQQCYTHFIDVRRSAADRQRFALQPVSELPRHGDRLLDPSGAARFTDLLLVRLDSDA